MNENTASIAALTLGAALFAAAPTGAQLRTLASVAPTAAVASDEDRDTARTVPEEIRKLIRAQLEGTVPAWDKSILTAYETPTPWEDNLEYRFLTKLLGESPFAWEGSSQPPPDADRFQDEAKSMRIRRADGAFRYHSRKRVFTPDLKGKGLPSSDAVVERMQLFLKDLGFPTREGAKPDVQTQEVAVGGSDGEVAERFPVYAFFGLERRIGGIPVEGSTVRAALNPLGEVQRVKIAWPHFKVRTGAEMRSRERVLEEAFQKVLAQDPTEKLQLASRLVYARNVKGEYLPAVQIDVSDGETPYRLTLPVAE